MKPLDKTSFETRIGRAFRVRSEAARVLYAASRRLLHPGTYVSRRRLALSTPPPFEISRRSGFAILNPGRFSEIDAVVAAVADIERRFGSQETLRGVGKGRKKFLIDILDRAELTLESPFLRFAMRNDVLAAVAAYLRLVPILSAISVFYSGPHIGEPESSQLYHCDGDDTTQMKVFVLCSDVGPASGPLTIMGAETSRELRSKVGYQFRQRVSDGEVARFIGTRDQHPLIGPAGTAFFVDTSRCFHFGSRVEAGAAPRVVAMFQFLTPFSFMLPADYRKGAPFRHLSTPALPRLQRLVLGNG